ncbi:MAG TPA: LCP family protein [Humibacter sp.]|nr:LCP family protein [Humibacter sp.]
MRRPHFPSDSGQDRADDASGLGLPGEGEHDSLDAAARTAARTRDASGAAPPQARRRRSRRVIGWTAFVVVALLVIGIGYGIFNYLALTNAISHVDAISGSNKPAADADGPAQNILLVGDDHRPANASAAELARLHAGPDDGENNTDTMMILHVPAGASSGAATLISLPRDSWVRIPGFGMGKLNSAFADGENSAAKGQDAAAAGAQLLIRTVQNLTGLTVDHYVRVSLLGFYDIADALGPIQVCLKHPVDDPYSGAKFPAGTSTLDAAQALAFVRQRHGLPNGDLDREVRQQYFLSVEAHKLLSAGTLLNPVALHNAMTAIGSALQTDPGLNLLQLAAQVRDLSGIRSATIPVSGTPTIYVDGTPVSIVQVDTAAMPAFITKLIGEPSAYTKAQPASPAHVTVTVLNGSGVEGAATAATKTFAAAGFHTGNAGNADPTTSTTIEYAAGDESQAKAVASHLPGAVVRQSSGAHDVTVVLGSDGLMPSARSGSSGGGSGSAGGSGSGGSGGSGSTATPKPTSSAPGNAYTNTTCID